MYVVGRARQKKMLFYDKVHILELKLCFWHLNVGIWAWDLAHELDHPNIFFDGLNESSGGLK